MPRRLSAQLAAQLAALLLCLCLCLALAAPAAAFTVTDSTGRAVTLTRPPQRIVSLVPGLTEMVLALGGGERLAGVTYHDEDEAPPGTPLVGGFFAPNIPAITRLKPQAILCAQAHEALARRFEAEGVAVLRLWAHDIADIRRNLGVVAALLGRPAAAEAAWAGVQARLDLAAQKTASLTPDQRPRTLRVMGVDLKRGELYTPGDDSFQNAYIRAAGGQPPVLGQPGQVARMTLAQWRKFAPQAVYICGDNWARLRQLLARPGWRDAPVAGNGRLYSFPCDHTCRASLRAGEFVVGLCAALHPALFNQPDALARPQGPQGFAPLDLGLPWVKRAGVARTVLNDLDAGALVIEPDAPMAALSTLAGQRRDVAAVVNYNPPAAWWGLGLAHDLDTVRPVLLANLGRAAADTALMVTGADMANAAVATAQDQGLKAVVAATAGVRHNAMRMGVERGGYAEPGTINLIVLTNRALTPRAMARAVISATEGKAAALQMLDVRSTARPELAATGTGTDNIVVLAGRGAPARLTGGHSVLGQLIGQAARQAVLEAIARQNGLRPGRSVFARLTERGVSLHALADAAAAGSASDGPRLLSALEGLLLEPRWAGLVEQALALSDAAAHGQVRDLSAFQQACRAAASQIAGRPAAQGPPRGGEDLPQPLAMALGALLDGLRARPAPDVPPLPAGAGASCG